MRKVKWGMKNAERRWFSWCDHAITLQRPSDTFDTCWLRNWHRPWPVVWSAVLHDAPSSSKKLQLVQSNAARIVLEAPRWSHASLLMRTLHQVPIQSPQHLDAIIPLLPNPGPTTQPQSAIGHYDAVSTFHDNNLCSQTDNMQQQQQQWWW